MIKFFRKIRQNLLSEGKTGKYVKNAIGEIVLVVIGILIALQINTWNTHRIERSKEDFVLIASMNDRYTFTITSPTYTELLSTGNLDLITDKTFKTQMVKYYEDLELTSQVIQNNNNHKDNVINPIALSILEIFGGSEPESVYRGLTSTYDNYETPAEVMTIVQTTISKPENQLILLNMIRFRRMVAKTHIMRLKLAKAQTEKLLNLLASNDNSR